MKIDSRKKANNKLGSKHVRAEVEENRGQFHQPYGAERKCAVQFHQQKIAQSPLRTTRKYAQLLCSTPCAIHQ
jgi:hypothetical protein